MIGLDPHTRRPGSSVPTHRGARVSPAPKSGQTGSDSRERALVPVNPTPHKTERARATAQASTGTRSAPSVLSLQCDAPTPRRGLRADAVERRRYVQTYEAAGRAPVSQARPTLVRCA